MVYGLQVRRGGDGCAFESKNQTVQKQIKDKGDRASVRKRGLIFVGEAYPNCYVINSIMRKLIKG